MRYLLILFILISTTLATDKEKFIRDREEQRLEKLERKKEKEAYNKNPYRKVEKVAPHKLLDFIKKDLKVFLSDFNNYFDKSPWFKISPFKEYGLPKRVADKKKWQEYLKRNNGQRITYAGESDSEADTRIYQINVSIYIGKDLQLLLSISKKIDTSDVYTLLNEIKDYSFKRMIKLSKLYREKHFGSHEKYLDILYSFSRNNVLYFNDIGDLYIKASMYDKKFLDILKNTKKTRGGGVSDRDMFLATLLNKYGRINGDLLKEALKYDDYKIKNWAVIYICKNKLFQSYKDLLPFYNNWLRQNKKWNKKILKMIPFKVPKIKEGYRPILKELPPLKAGY
ncbi:MAG: hypothetical protein COB02_16000 [Candidatus Cloacimonadota bacterium]|nr:MAG: hypothetical protein COB02_16000 [Candidatus Cloacimonadota bacterium]